MMSDAMQKSWKNRLQEYCQKNKLRLPNYRIRQEPGAPNEMKFQVEVEVDGRWYIGEENCSSKKDAEHSAAQKACIDLIGNNVEFDSQKQSCIGPAINENDPSKHMPPEYADIEEYIATMLGAFGARIRKVKPPDARGKYRLEITNNYRYCENIKNHHKKNQVYFLVDPIKKVYYQKCYDPDCQGFQSAKTPIYIKQAVNNPQENSLTSA